MDENPYKSPADDEASTPASIPKTVRQPQRRPWGLGIGVYLGISIGGMVATEAGKIQDDQRSHNPIFGLSLMFGGILGAALGLGLDFLRWRRSDRH